MTRTPKAEATSAATKASRPPRKADLSRKRKTTTKASRSSPPASPQSPESGAMTKTDILLDLLGQPGGATLDDLCTASGWQAHSVRGFLSGTVRKKRQLSLTSDRDEDGVRRYAVTA